MYKEPLTPVRAEELALLRRTLLLARESPQFTRVTGEAWSGKTCLMRRLSKSAQREGWTVAFGSVPRPGPSRPFEVLVDALDEHLGRADGSLFAALGTTHTRALAAYFPSLATAPGVPCTALAPPDAYGAVRALRALIEILAGDGGLLLALDDVHRASPETLDFLTHLVHHPPRAPVLTVFAHRTGATARHLSAVSYDSSRVRHLPLAPLPEDQARTLLPAGLDPVTEAQALRDGAGVPGLLRALAHEPGAGLRAVPELSLGAPPVLQHGPVELHSLSALGWHTACAAAVLGSPFTPGQAAATAQLSEEEVRRGLDELHAEGLVVPDGSALRFRFTRPAVRALLYHASGAGWRGAARQRAVLALRADRSPAARLALAAHLEDTDPLSAADVRELTLAARDGLFRQPARSVRALRRVTAYPQASLESHLLLYKALVVAGEPEEALRGYAGLWPRVHALWAPDGRYEALLWRVRALRLLGRGEQARVLLDADGSSPAQGGELLGEWAALALESVPEPGSGSGASGSGSGASGSGSGASGWEAALEAAHGALAAAGPPQDPGHAHALARLAAVQSAAGDLAGAAHSARGAAPLLDSLDDDGCAAVLEALRWLVCAECALGDPAALRHAERGVRLALRHGQGLLLGQLASGLARARLAAGDRAGAGAPAALAAEAFRRIGAPVPMPVPTPLPAPAPTPDVSGINRRVAGYQPAGNVEGLLSELSSRELEIASLVGDGSTNQNIATRLDISVKTVETYMSRIFKKLGVNSRSQVARAIGRNDGH
ncbi:AAA family ATPase [Streptomyces sp. ISL-43]|uniref:helix-turn-helix transcriptional regulator n=1 Tax=Streptomyces sp. ISL-43 TaxID=2819183 RepID=UPI001BE8AAB2|nr:helix-turn-helix transcriptional regulator [Streptomyces sp. ISL-43]MBT2446415.1 AAA family ATPase [Streptomyces sp. ISL-43]